MKKIDLVFVLNATANANNLLDFYSRAINDAEKPTRIKEQLCQRCYYQQKVGGSMYTDTNCGLCTKTMKFPSTYVDLLCYDCAKAYKLCKHCAGDIALRHRRKL